MSRIKNLREEALAMHKNYQGKIEVRVKVPVRETDDLTLAYSPGVAEPCMEIHKNPADVDTYTNHSNFVCVVSNGTAVLGLGDIGPAAAMPVMEGKSLLFKTFGDVDAFPLCVNTKDTAKIVEMVELLAPTFGGVNLEDIKAPECFVIEDSLKKNGVFKGPIFHDDQHGTAVVTLADQRPESRGQEAGRRQGGHHRRGRGGHRHHQAAHGRGPQERDHVRLQGRHLGRTSRGHESLQGRDRQAHQP